MAVSTSQDGKIKSWVVVDSDDGVLKKKKKKEEEEEEEGEGEGKEKRLPSWACRWVGYFQWLPCRAAVFSEDGSLLAANFEKVGRPPQV